MPRWENPKEARKNSKAKAKVGTKSRKKKKIERLGGLRREVIDAKEPWRFEITKEHLKGAKRCDGRECVVARAISERFGPFFEEVHIGPTVSKIMAGNRVFRYSTPNRLSVAVVVFDRTGKWNLEPGWYYLNPFRDHSNFQKLRNKERMRKIREAKKKGKLVTFNPRVISNRTRRVKRVDGLLVVG